MAKSTQQLEQVPIDTRFGVPWPVAPDQVVEHTPKRRHGGRAGETGYARSSRGTNRHHANFPRARLVGYGRGPLAERHSLMQDLLVPVHDALHATLAPPELAETDEQRIGKIAVSLLCYVPEQALGFTPDGEPYKVILTPEQRDRLWRADALHIDVYEPIRTFLLEHVLQYGVRAIDEEAIEEFLRTNPGSQKHSKGRDLMDRACTVVTQPFQADYAEAIRAGLFPDGVPAQLGQFVCDLLVLNDNGNVSGKVIAEVESSLRAA